MLSRDFMKFVPLVYCLSIARILSPLNLASGTTYDMEFLASFLLFSAAPSSSDVPLRSRPVVKCRVGMSYGDN